MNTLKAFLVGLTLLLLSDLAQATTRYIDGSATGCSNPDTDYNPTTRACGSGSSIVYTTFGAAATGHVGGDEVIIRAGTYDDSLRNRIKSGTAGAPTIWRAYGSVGAYEVVTIRPPSDIAADTGIYLPGTDYVTVRGFILDGVNTVRPSNFGVRLDAASDNFTIEDCEIKNFGTNMLVGSTTGPASNGVIRRVIMHDNNSTDRGDHNLYLSNGVNWLIEDSEFYRASGWGLHLYPNMRNSTVRRNKVYQNALSQHADPSQVQLSDDNNIFEYNTVSNIVDPQGYGVKVQYSTPSGSIVRHNSLYNAGAVGIYIEAAASGIIVQNNIVLGSATAIENLGSGTTLTDNRTTGTATDIWIDPANNDLRLKAGSVAINDGTNIGLAFNGSAPDQGAYEVPAFSSCVVENGDASTLRITFQNNLRPPLLPSTGITGFTARKAGANNVVTAAVRTGDNRVDLTLTDAIVNGNTVDISYSGSGNLTDSALIGNTSNQPYNTVLTNQPCTNNVGAAAAHVFTQAAFEFHGLRGTEAAPVGTPYATAPENTNIQVRVGGSVRLRIALTCTIADCPPTGFYPRYSKNAGAYTVIPDIFAADNIGFCGVGPDPDIPTNGTATTNQLSTAGAFVAGALVRTSNAIPTIDLDDSPAQKTELEYCVSFDTDATAGDTYDVRLYEQDGTALGAYTFTPRITLAAERAGMGF